jgi:hypothetical protein
MFSPFRPNHLPGGNMATFDIFEALRDGSYIWRASVSDFAERDRKLQELAKTSNNTFCALDQTASKTLSLDLINPGYSSRLDSLRSAARK